MSAGSDSAFFRSSTLVYFATLVSEVGQSEIPLPEIQREDFKRAWTRFELVAKAKEWNKAKQLAIIPTLLRGKLLDTYVELPDESKESWIKQDSTMTTIMNKQRAH